MFDATVIEAINAGGNLGTMVLAFIIMRLSIRVRALELRDEIAARMKREQQEAR